MVDHFKGAFIEDRLFSSRGAKPMGYVFMRIVLVEGLEVAFYRYPLLQLLVIIYPLPQFGLAEEKKRQKKLVS